MTLVRRCLEAFASIKERSATTVDSRSSQKVMGIMIELAILLANARVD
mgnify:CR=1